MLSKLYWETPGVESIKKKENIFHYAVIFVIDPLGLSVVLILFSST